MTGSRNAFEPVARIVRVMDLREYQGKQLFAEHDIPTPDSVTVTDVDALDTAALPDSDRVVVKAQVPVGKREEHGGIKIVDRDDARDAARDLLGATVNGHTVTSVLVEEAVDIAQELYVSLSINRAGKNYHLVFSEQGGSGIEERAQEADATRIVDFYEYDRAALADAFSSVEQSEAVLDIVEQLHDLLREEDALLAEINPLVVTGDGAVVAADAKVRLDDNALHRHDRDFVEHQEDPMEFVPLDGNIAVIGNGAGLVMATLDSIHHFGGSPADFLDIGGGADFETMKEAMRTAMEMEHVDGMFVNIFGGITRCDEVAQGIIDFVDEEAMEIPLVVRMVGTNQDEGRQLLEDNGIHALDSMAACAEKIADLVEPDEQAAVVEE